MSHHYFDQLTDRLAVIYSAPGEIRVRISGHDENRTLAPHQSHGTQSTKPHLRSCKRRSNLLNHQIIASSDWIGVNQSVNQVKVVLHNHGLSPWLTRWFLLFCLIRPQRLSANPSLLLIVEPRLIDCQCDFYFSSWLKWRLGPGVIEDSNRLVY